MKNKIKAGMRVKYKDRVFDVVSYDGGFIEDKKGELKLMERKSMLDGAIDFFLDEMPESEIVKIEILTPFITQNKKNLVITIPKWQKSFNHYMASDDNPEGYCGEVSNFIGCINGDKFGFVQVIDLAYKGDTQYGGFIVELSEGMGVEEFRQICQELEIYIYEYPLCAYCGKVIYGCFTISDKGNQCSKCEAEENKSVAYGLEGGSLCPHCQSQVMPYFIYCAKCGKKI